MLLAVCVALFKWEVSETTVQLALFFLWIEYNYNYLYGCNKMVYVWELAIYPLA